ncbi:hypothetical protein K7432_012491 [Basidiobolus ranarum]|uniref:Transmembrane protein 18 n=1 Tax=Basidiobolus ranarum TaxID=34480 RepID=A0ABR2VSC7_9FUNG
MNTLWNQLDLSFNNLKSLFFVEASNVNDKLSHPLLDELKRKLKEDLQGSGLVADIARFFYAVNWNQYWIQALMASHVLTFLLIILSKNREYLLITLLIILILLAASAEHVNYLGGLYWDRFSVANYFDSHGFFILIVYALPIICNASLILIILLSKVAQLLIRAKRLELQAQLKTSPKQKQKLH